MCEDNQIVSRTDVPLIVTAGAFGSATENSEVVLVSAPEDLTNTAKTLFVWVEFQPLPSPNAKVEWSGVYTGADNQIVINDDAKDVLVIPAADADAPTCAVFRAFGYAGIPDEIWGTQDNANFQISFKFTPELAEPSDATEPVEDTEAPDDTQPVENAGASENTETVENAESSNDMEPVEDAEPSDLTEVAEDVEPPDVAKPVEEEEASDVTEPAEDAGVSEDTAPVENMELSEDTESVEEAETSKDRNFADSAEFP